MSTLPLRLAKLWFRHFALICLLLGIEGVAVWSSGFRFRSRHSIEKAWIPGSKLSIDKRERWAAARVYIRQRNNQVGAKAAAIMLDLEKGQTRRLDLGVSHPLCVALSPDAEWLVVACEDRSLRVFRGPTTDNPILSAKFEPPCPQVHRLEFSPTGDFLAALGNKETVVWNWPRSSIAWQAANDRHPGGQLCFSEDENYLAANDVSGRLCAWDAATGEVEYVIDANTRDLIDLVWSNQEQAWIGVYSDGDRVAAYVCDEKSRRLMWQADVNSIWSSNINRGLLALVSVESGLASVQVVDLRSGQVIDRVATGSRCLSGVHISKSGGLYSWCDQGKVVALPLENRGRQWSRSLIEIASQADWLSFKSPSSNVRHSVD